MIFRLEPPLPCHTPHGEGSAFLFIDRGVDHNPEYVVRCSGGQPRNYFSCDIRVLGNPMDGDGYDLKIPKEWKQ